MSKDDIDPTARIDDEPMTDARRVRRPHDAVSRAQAWEVDDVRRATGRVIVLTPCAPSHHDL